MAEVRLNWKDISPSEQGFRIYRSDAPIDTNNPPEPYATLPADTESFVDAQIDLGVVYYYYVSSFKDNIEKFSDVRIVNTGLSPLGPGPNILIGNDESTGFFGEVPADELITGDALASMIGLTGGTSQNSTTPWLKFFMDDKILFIPKTSLRHSISWDAINSVNAVYGDREIDLLGYRFKIRLLQGIGPGETVTYSNGFDLPATHQSEWNRLFYPISEESTNADYYKLSQTGHNWATYSQAELNISTGDGRRTWCQEAVSDEDTRRAVRGGNAVTQLNWTASSISSTSYGWRPVLELVSQ